MLPGEVHLCAPFRPSQHKREKSVGALRFLMVLVFFSCEILLCDRAGLSPPNTSRGLCGINVAAQKIWEERGPVRV